MEPSNWNKTKLTSFNDCNQYYQIKINIIREVDCLMHSWQCLFYKLEMVIHGNLFIFKNPTRILLKMSRLQFWGCQSVLCKCRSGFCLFKLLLGFPGFAWVIIFHHYSCFLYLDVSLVVFFKTNVQFWYRLLKAHSLTLQ